MASSSITRLLGLYGWPLGVNGGGCWVDYFFISDFGVRLGFRGGANGIWFWVWAAVGFGFDLGFLLMGCLGFVMGWSGCVTGSGVGVWVVLGSVADLGKSGGWFCRLDLVATIGVCRKYILF